MERLICIVMGYVFGLFQSGYLYSKKHDMDIRQHGSGNAGATNILRVMGAKAGLIVFLGDAFKTILAVLLTRYLFRGQAELLPVLCLYTGCGVIMGHNYPFYMGFKGGKGIACTAGLMAAVDWRITLICLVAFASIVYATRYVSLGSIVVVTIFAIGTIVFGSMGYYGVPAANLPELYACGIFVCVMGVYRHRANIKRLLSGTENKLGAKKQ